MILPNVATLDGNALLRGLISGGVRSLGFPTPPAFKSITHKHLESILHTLTYYNDKGVSTVYVRPYILGFPAYAIIKHDKIEYMSLDGRKIHHSNSVSLDYSLRNIRNFINFNQWHSYVLQGVITPYCSVFNHPPLSTLYIDVINHEDIRFIQEVAKDNIVSLSRDQFPDFGNYNTWRGQGNSAVDKIDGYLNEVFALDKVSVSYLDFPRVRSIANVLSVGQPAFSPSKVVQRIKNTINLESDIDVVDNTLLSFDAIGTEYLTISISRASILQAEDDCTKYMHDLMLSNPKCFGIEIEADLTNIPPKQVSTICPSFKIRDQTLSRMAYGIDMELQLEPEVFKLLPERKVAVAYVKIASSLFHSNKLLRKMPLKDRDDTSIKLSTMSAIGQGYANQYELLSHIDTSPFFL